MYVYACVCSYLVNFFQVYFKFSVSEETIKATKHLNYLSITRGEKIII